MNPQPTPYGQSSRSSCRERDHSTASIRSALRAIGDAYVTKVAFGGLDDCWPWLAARMGTGYGEIHRRGRVEYVHRLAFEAFHGEIPPGLQVVHTCRQKACCNPLHLEAVTPREQTYRGNSPAGINARKAACIHGHPLNPENLYTYASPHTSRVCRECHLARDRAKRACQTVAA